MYTTTITTSACNRLEWSSSSPSLFFYFASILCMFIFFFLPAFLVHIFCNNIFYWAMLFRLKMVWKTRKNGLNCQRSIVFLLEFNEFAKFLLNEKIDERARIKIRYSIHTLYIIVRIILSSCTYCYSNVVHIFIIRR